MSPVRDNTPTRTEDLHAGPRGRAAAVRIRAVDGPGAPAEYTLTAGTITIGSSSDCELVVSDKAVSRRHATVELLAGAIRVRDLGSRNGILYLGGRMSEATLPVGGSIQVGRTTLRFFSPEEDTLHVSPDPEFHELLGGSFPMRRLFALARQVAGSDSTVLIQGETGAGKEALARAIHAASARSPEPFVAFDCAAVSADLLDSELFGHAAGAFTGAQAARPGVVEAAGQGTLFLDELGGLPMDLQPKLLRLLEQREYRRIGEDTLRTTRVRIIASTSRDLEVDAAEGRFRKDLFFRIAVAQLKVPPLRERLEDVPLLAKRFAAQAAGKHVDLAPEIFASLQSYPWPGNVRELRNSVQRVLTLGSIELSDPPSTTTPLDSKTESFNDIRRRALDAFEKQFLLSLIERTGGNMSEAGRRVGLARSHLYRLLKRHRLGPFAKE
jgi:DNA-binding NtrC family response regulator